MIKNPIKYDPIENFLFFMAVSASKRLDKLNTPDLKMKCPCSGRMIKYRITNRGSHYFCLKCFTKWVKPSRGGFYRMSDNKARVRESNKIRRWRTV